MKVEINILKSLEPFNFREFVLERLKKVYSLESLNKKELKTIIKDLSKNKSSDLKISNYKPNFYNYLKQVDGSFCKYDIKYDFYFKVKVSKNLIDILFNKKFDFITIEFDDVFHNYNSPYKMFFELFDGTDSRYFIIYDSNKFITNFNKYKVFVDNDFKEVEFGLNASLNYDMWGDLITNRRYFLIEYLSFLNELKTQDLSSDCCVYYVFYDCKVDLIRDDNYIKKISDKRFFNQKFLF